ncbi:hypothetical protein KXR53_32805 [Inquilinus limosus]|uniref:hypothetical protein n=1 Tax=Inquilinus limosus TaxID=171674 RepID=UPI003F17470B
MKRLRRGAPAAAPPVDSNFGPPGLGILFGDSRMGPDDVDHPERERIACRRHVCPPDRLVPSCPDSSTITIRIQADIPTSQPLSSAGRVIDAVTQKILVQFLQNALQNQKLETLSLPLSKTNDFY